MTTAERKLAAIKHQHLHAELFKTPFNLIGEKAEPKKFTPRPVWKQEQLFTTKGER